MMRWQIPLLLMLALSHPMARVRNLEIVELINGKRRGPESLLIGKVRKYLGGSELFLGQLSDHQEAFLLLLEVVKVLLVFHNNLVIRCAIHIFLLQHDRGSQLINQNIARHQRQQSRLIKRTRCLRDNQAILQLLGHVLTRG